MHETRTLTILSVQIGLPKMIEEGSGRAWTTGFYKDHVLGPIAVTTANLEGDGQADLRVHGGPEKAINVYPSEHYPYWIETLAFENFPFGAFGENFTTSGALENDLCIGDIFESEGPHAVTLQISQPRQPCWKLSRRWNIKDLSAQVERNGKTGWYFRVLREGQIETGSMLKLISRPHPEWSIAQANEVMHHRKHDPEIAIRLAACAGLSTSWKDSLSRRAMGASSESAPRLHDPADS